MIIIISALTVSLICWLVVASSRRGQAAYRVKALAMTTLLLMSPWSAAADTGGTGASTSGSSGQQASSDGVRDGAVEFRERDGKTVAYDRDGVKVDPKKKIIMCYLL